MAENSAAEGQQPDAEAGGLQLHPERDKHVFKAPAPRQSVLGEPWRHLDCAGLALRLVRLGLFAAATADRQPPAAATSLPDHPAT